MKSPPDEELELELDDDELELDAPELLLELDELDELDEELLPELPPSPPHADSRTARKTIGTTFCIFDPLFKYARPSIFN